jgi:hypothetical protein
MTFSRFKSGVPGIASHQATGLRGRSLWIALKQNSRNSYGEFDKQR